MYQRIKGLFSCHEIRMVCRCKIPHQLAYFPFLPFTADSQRLIDSTACPEKKICQIYTHIRWRAVGNAPVELKTRYMMGRYWNVTDKPSSPFLDKAGQLTMVLGINKLGQWSVLLEWE